MNLIKRVFNACLLTLAAFLLIIIGAGGMLLDLLGAAASALISAALIGIGCEYLEREDD